MKLTRLHIAQFRQFRSGLEIAEFGSGLNIFAGPNEAGKSTVAAAIRAAFLERYRSSAAADFLPWGETRGSPGIELDFEWDGRHYSLAKYFLKDKRCVLSMADEQLDGEQAESALADLFGYDLAAKGLSKAEHWGVPGLLWIQQGTGQDVSDALIHARSHLSGVLQHTLEELASADGDTLIARIAALRAEFLTPGGKPTGEYGQAKSQLEALVPELAAEAQQIATYRAQVDELRNCEILFQQESRSLPWEDYAARQQEAQRRLEQIDALLAQEQADRQTQEQYSQTLSLLMEQAAAYHGEREALLQREAAHASSGQEVQDAGRLAAQTLAAQRQLEEAYERARKNVQGARDLERMRQFQAQVRQLAGQLAGAQTQLAAAGAALDAMGRLREALGGRRLDQEFMVRLRRQHAAVRELEVRQSSIATRLRYHVSGAQSLMLDDRELDGSGEILLLREARIDIPGVAHFELLPGGADLADFLRQKSESEERLAASLQQCGVATLDEAEAEFARQHELSMSLQQAEQQLSFNAPHGIEALRSAIDDLRQAQDLAQAQLSPLEGLDAARLPTLEQAEQALERIRLELAEATRLAQLAANGLAIAQASHDSLSQECGRLSRILEDPQRQERQRVLNERIVELRARLDVMARSMAERRRQIDAAQPEILRQDSQRYAQSATAARKAFDERSQRINYLRGQLEQAGAQGLEERHAEKGAHQQRLRRRVEEFEQRSRAFDLLLGLLQQKRHAAMQRLQAPLQRYLNHYLGLWLPGSTLQLGEDLLPTGIERNRQGRVEQSGLGALSYGAREQLGLISRLAYADLLREAGRPTLLMLDDALVHSDPERLDRMKRIVFDAAQRHQFLMFTCHPEWWRDMGVPIRDIDQFRL